jgi:hypothetical protein
MLWCLLGIATITSLLGLATLNFRPPRIRLRLGSLLRGCVATALLLAALGVTGLVLLLAR